MDSYYSLEELLALGLKKVGKNVLISKKCSLYSVEKIEIGDFVRIDDFCILSGKIVLGDYIHIAAYSAIYGGLKGVFIDDYANISSRVTIYAINDDYSGKTMTNPMIPEQYKDVTEKPVYIKKHVIIGSTSVVLPGIILEEGCAFGSFSLINHNTEAWTINAGIPCVKIKERKKDLLNLTEEFKKDREQV